jgi:hypothetical protein
MTRPARGLETLERARDMLAQAETVEQLRQAQALVLPLDCGLTLAQTAHAIGRSVPWTCRLRNRLIAGEVVGDGQRPSRGGRQHENMSPAQEAELLAPFLAQHRSGRALVISEVRAALEARLGRRVALSSVYNVLHRYGWEKARAGLPAAPASPRKTSRRA